MLRTGTDAYSGVLDHRGIRASDDMVVMPLQCGTQWDGLGHIFYENYMWNGYDCREVTSAGAQKCGIEKTKNKMVGRGVFLDLPKIKEAILGMDSDKIVSDLNQDGEIKILISSKNIILNRDAFLINKKSNKGYTSESDGNITVGLTTELSEKLVQEGIARDVIRHVQIMRKNANFAVEDRIIIYGSFDGEVGDAIQVYDCLLYTSDAADE